MFKLQLFKIRAFNFATASLLNVTNEYSLYFEQKSEQKKFVKRT